MSYKVKLEVFEGPLDLLLYLIRKEEVDIYDIPIAKITEQYLQYFELMKLLDLNIAGEFIVMAATLMHIKSRMLLPPEERQAEEEEEELDPRSELVKRLLEYKRFKEAAVQLEEMELERRDMFTRAVSRGADGGENGGSFFEASLFDLITAFSKVLKEISRDDFKQIIADEFTVEGKMHEILQTLTEVKIISFLKLFEAAKNKFEIIATFLALLELVRLKLVFAGQKEDFDDIQIARR